MDEEIDFSRVIDNTKVYDFTISRDKGLIIKYSKLGMDLNDKEKTLIIGEYLNNINKE